jgi:hypothetical protein
MRPAGQPRLAAPTPRAIMPSLIGQLFCLSGINLE